MAALPPGLAQALGPVLEIAEMTKKIKQLRPTHQAAYGDRVPRDAAVDPGLRRWPAHGANVCSHAGQQGTIPAKMVTQDAGIVIACPLRATGPWNFGALNAFSFLLRKF
jgi:hypothetical protein